MQEKNRATTTPNKAESFDVTMPLLEAMYEEFKTLSRGKSSEAISKKKIEVVNRLLKDCHALLEDERSIRYLEILNEDDVPLASDVLLMLSQFRAAMNSFKGKYHGWNALTRESTWFTSGG